MGSPTRHGVDWGRVGPSPTAPAELDASKKGGGGGPFQPATPNPQVIPVSVIDAFFQELPELSIQPIVKTMEGQFALVVDNPWDPDTSTIQPIRLSFFTVPQQFVYIIVDVVYYAVVPGAGLNDPPASLTAEQLAGIARFDLTFGNRQPARFDCSMLSPYANPGTSPVLRTGWPFIETKFGPQRTTGFAIYARSSQEVLVTVQMDDFPLFTISKFGAHMHGYAVPEGAFEDIFVRRRLGR